MGDVTELFSSVWDRLDGMDVAALKALLEQVNRRLSELDAEEPEDMESEAYEDWADRHEELEDLADELLDRLES